MEAEARAEHERERLQERTSRKNGRLDLEHSFSDTQVHLMAVLRSLTTPQHSLVLMSIADRAEEVVEEVAEEMVEEVVEEMVEEVAEEEEAASKPDKTAGSGPNE